MSNSLGVLKECHLGIVGALLEDVRERAVVVVPGKLEWSSAKVALSILDWPCFSGPARCGVVAGPPAFATLACDLLEPVKALTVEIDTSIVSFPLRIVACLLYDVRKESRDFSCCDQFLGGFLYVVFS